MFLPPSAALCAQSVPSPSVLKVAGGEIEITLPDEPLDLTTSDLLGWVKSSATAVAGVGPPPGGELARERRGLPKGIRDHLGER